MIPHSYKQDYSTVSLLFSSVDSDVSLIQHKSSGEKFFIKTVKERHDPRRMNISRNIRFARELNFVLALEHPNIAQPVDYRTDAGEHTMMYRYHTGRTLARLLEEKKVMNPSEVFNLFLQILDSLEYIHSRGIVHCDLSPHNIYVCDDGKVQLIDFGYAMTEKEALRMPEGRIVGTIPFVSPEQIGLTGFKIDSRSDLYCFGILLYLWLSGKFPFQYEENSIDALVTAMVKKSVKAVKNLSGSLNALLIRSLKPGPEERYQTATGFKYDLQLAIREHSGELIEGFSVGERDEITAVNRRNLFIAREQELETLQTGYRGLMLGKAASYLLYGPSGIGKTEIVREFEITLPNEEVAFISCKANRFSSSFPYSVLRQIVLAYLSNISMSDSSDRRRFEENLNKEMSDHSGIICKIIPEMARYFRSVKPVDVIEKEKEADRFTHVLGLFMRFITTIKPAIFFLDDLQWVDKTTFDIFMNMVTLRIPCMVVFCYRTGGKNENMFVHGYDLKTSMIQKKIKISGFGANEIRYLVESRFGNIENLDAIADALGARTDGLPFTLTEVMRYMVNESVIKPKRNTWLIDLEQLEEIPKHLDPVSLIMKKMERLDSERKELLQLASLIEGCFNETLIMRLGNYDEKFATVSLNMLEILGFLTRKFTGEFVFAHDRVQETIAAGIPYNDRLELNQKLGEIYEDMARIDREYIFSAAECFMKTRNVNKSIETCEKAAHFAAESIAFDPAIRYFKHAMFMARQFRKLGKTIPLDLTKLQIDFSDVLMLSGKNKIALHVLHNMLKDEEGYDENTVLEIKYRIGTIYHNMGEFERSVPFFKEILKGFGIKVDINNHIFFLRLIWELIYQFFFSKLVSKCRSKRSDRKRLLIVRILNKLSYSLYFENMLEAFFVHFKALNLCDTLIDSNEKVEAYALHAAPAYQMLLKKRAFHYLNKSSNIAKKIKRNDAMSFSEYVTGVIHLYNSSWQKCINFCNESIHRCNMIGDHSSQIQNLEHIWKAYLMKGELNAAEEIIERTIDTCRKSKEKHFLLVALSAETLIKYLNEKKEPDSNLKEIHQISDVIKSFLTFSHMGGFVIELYTVKKQFKKAYSHAMDLIPYLWKYSINAEYNVLINSSFAELLNLELRNRHHTATYPKESTDASSESSIPATTRKLKRQFITNAFTLWFSCLSYPAYWGAFYRNSAWFLHLHGFHGVAHYLFKRAITKHHTLSMRYEEAKSLRDFGLFLEECNKPGEARDYFHRAYELFHICGAKLETDRLSNRVDVSVRGETQGVVTTEYEPLKNTMETEQFRLENLCSVASSITDVDDLDILFHQILRAMIKATGAQYGYMYLPENKWMPRYSLTMNFEGGELAPHSIDIDRTVVTRAERERSIVLKQHDTEKARPVPDESGQQLKPAAKSILCVPLFRKELYLGFVYLGNNMVSDLFSEGAKKAVQVLSFQAGILMENALMMQEYRRLNRDLQRKVREQTNDIKEKNTQLEEYTIKIVDTERMKSILTGTLVHDIKNHVSGISGNLEFLRRQRLADERRHKTLSFINESCSGIVSMASNLLDIGKMEEGKLDVRKEEVDVEKIDRITEKYRSNIMFVEKEVTVELWKPPGPFTVLADVYLLDRLMQNLYSNAAKYSQKNGHVVLSFENNEVENESVLCFFNAGRPIPEEFRNTLFDKYSRMDGHSTQYSKGLGLFFCQMVMLAHGGRIWLDTDEKGNYFKLGFKREKAILVPNETCEESEQTTSLKTAGMAGMLSMMGLGL